VPPELPAPSQKLPVTPKKLSASPQKHPAASQKSFYTPPAPFVISKKLPVDPPIFFVAPPTDLLI
jgi:hypothetical protein